MKKSILFSLPGNEALAKSLAEQLKMESGVAEFHEFPDGEICVRVESEVKNKSAILVCTLDHPDAKLLRLFFLAQTLRELGVLHLCLISPYLPYMRQDAHFKPGDALSASIFAKLLSAWVDQLITIDPHLHRIRKLSDIYSIPEIATLHAGKKMSEWIAEKIPSPFIIGPDEESQQWVGDVAGNIDAPYAIISKIRQGDRAVEIRLPELRVENKTLVLIDDIISTGTTLLAALGQLRALGHGKITCLCVHALFDRKIYDSLLAAGAERIVSCNTIPHFTNELDLSGVIAAELKV